MTLTCKARRTLAQKPIDPVNTLAPIVARLRVAIVDVHGTVRSFESLLADTGVLVASRVHTGASVLAGIRLAWVQFSWNQEIM